MTGKKLIYILLLVIATGCEPESGSLPIAGTSTDNVAIIKTSNEGPVLLAFSPHPISRLGAPGGIHRAITRVAGEFPCSAAVFHISHKSRADKWLLREANKRLINKHSARVILCGHSFAGADAGETAGWILSRSPDIIVQMLLTVDAIKNGMIGGTTGAAVTLLTLDNPVPGKKVYFFAYDGSPRVDGRRMLSHVNYYQQGTGLYHGRPMSGTQENWLIAPGRHFLVNHGNIDDYVYPLVLGDLRQAMREALK